MRLHSYIVAFDGGFAPCVTKSLCTLACCKPRIRAKAEPGDWVLGTTTEDRGAGRVVYLMQVQRVLSFAEYYRDPQLCRRRDCIYRPLARGDYQQKKNPWHGHANIKKDLSGKRVLLAKRFVYLRRERAPHPARISEVRCALSRASYMGNTGHEGQESRLLRHDQLAGAVGFRRRSRHSRQTLRPPRQAHRL